MTQPRPSPFIDLQPAHRVHPWASDMSAPARPLPVADLVGAITLDPEFRMEDVLRALDTMTAAELEELAELLDAHDAAVRKVRGRLH
jgi:hypothetical protein